MKILCETQIVNRETQTAQMPRMVKATLAVGFHQTATDRHGQNKKELEIIHFTPKNKLGKRYKVRNNIEKIFTKFVKDGKATISFKQPPENLLLKCDPVQLKAFLHTLKLGLEGKDSANLKVNIASTTAVPQQFQCPTKLTIMNRSDYPTKGFPRSLKNLTISGLKMCKIAFDLTSLKNLTVLNLSNNELSEIPNEMGRLCLKTLNLSNNILGDKNWWLWLKGSALRGNLRELDLSNNRIKYFVPQLIQYENLVKLSLDNNKIERLPFGIRRMRSLRYLHLAHNHLISLSSECASVNLEYLDICGNKFLEPISYDMASLMKTNFNTPPQLWQLCCKAVSIYKLPFKDNGRILLPRILEDVLLEAPRCACGHIVCYSNAKYERAVSADFTNVKNLHLTSRHMCADIVLCGPNCMGKKRMIIV